MACEVTIKIKDREKSLTQKTMIYDIISTEFRDPEIEKLISKAQKNFCGDKDLAKLSVTIKVLD